MDINRLAAYRDDPGGPGNAKYARELLRRCGPLVLDGVQYSCEADNDRINSVPVEFLQMDRVALASGIDKLKVESA